MKILMLVILIAVPMGMASARDTEQTGSKKVVLFILDTFEGSDSHGKNVSEVAEASCLHRCEIKKVPLGIAVDRQRYIDALEDIITYARNHPHRRIVVNMSFGSYHSNDREKSLIREMTNRGIIVVAAVGNDATDRPMYPAGYDGVVAVSALNSEGKERYSNYGSYVDIGTEGYLRSDMVKREDKVQGAYREENTTWLITGGTSFAAPRVSGFVGYLLSQRPDVPSEKMISLLKQTATPLKGDMTFAMGKLGAGRLDEYKMLYTLDPTFHRLVGIHQFGWVPFLLVWTIVCIRAGRRRDLFGPLVEGVFLAILVIVMQFYAIWIWGQVQGRYVGIGIWLAVGMLGVIVLILRARERTFVRNYALTDELLQSLAQLEPQSGEFCIRRAQLVHYLVHDQKIRPDLADAIIDRHEVEGRFQRFHIL